MTTSESGAVTRSFAVTGPLTVSIEAEQGALHVSAGDVSEATVMLSPSRPGDQDAIELISQTKIDMRGNSLRIETPRSGGFRASRVLRPGDSAPIDIEVTVPTGSTMKTKLGAVDTTLDGTFGDVDVTAGSGHIRIEECADATVKTGSGDIQVGVVAVLRAKSGSGDISVESARSDLEVSSGSGDITVLDLGRNGDLSTASGDVQVSRSSGVLGIKTASGDVTVRRADSGEITIKTATGAAVVGVAEGTATLLDCSSVTGQVRSELEPSDEPMTEDTPRLAVRARTVSGSVTIQRA